MILSSLFAFCLFSLSHFMLCRQTISMFGMDGHQQAPVHSISALGSKVSSMVSPLVSGPPWGLLSGAH